MRGDIGNEVQEPDVTEDFKQFLIIMYGSNSEKNVLTYQIMIVDQLYALFTSYGKLSSRVNRAWLNQFDSWTPSGLRAKLQGLAESGGFSEIKLALH